MCLYYSNFHDLVIIFQKTNILIIIITYKVQEYILVQCIVYLYIVYGKREIIFTITITIHY